VFQTKAAFWVTGNLKTGLSLEHFSVEMDDIPEFDIPIKKNDKILKSTAGKEINYLCT